MNEISTRLNLIQRAMQRGALARDRAPTDQVAADQRTSVVPGEAETVVEPLPRLQPEKISRNAEAVQLEHAQLRASQIVTPEDRYSPIYNEFRSLKRKLLPMTWSSTENGIPQNVVMVTSALPREGKTFTVMNLAICLAAEQDLEVILVDGDVIRGSIAQYFNGEKAGGLIDILAGSRRLDEVLHPCGNLPRLHVLFAGKQDRAAPELLASPRMGDLCRTLSTRFENGVVLFDTPPVLASPESTALAPHAHHLIMLVSAGYAARNQVEAALTEVRSCPNTSLLFNRVPEWQRPLTPASYYGMNIQDSESVARATV